jgi:hypothetical protein
MVHGDEASPTADFSLSFFALSLRPTKCSAKKKIHIFCVVLITFLNKINLSLKIHIHRDTTLQMRLYSALDGRVEQAICVSFS